MAIRIQPRRIGQDLRVCGEATGVPILPTVLPQDGQGVTTIFTIPIGVCERENMLMPTTQDGRPVYLEHLGKVDLTALYKITSQERMLTNLAVEYEKVSDPRLPACSRKAGKLLETCCTIMDLKGVGITSVPSVYGYLKSASIISQDYYPERLGKLYVINAPWGFSTVFGVVKGVLDPGMFPSSVLMMESKADVSQSPSTKSMS